LLEIDRDGSVPEFSSDLFAGDEHAGLRSKQLQDSKWLGLQEDAATVLAQLAHGEVEFENAEPQ
jgi:hypothetical protein